MGDMADDLIDWEYKKAQKLCTKAVDEVVNKNQRIVYTWTTKDGRKIPLPEMTIEHLENVYRLLLNNNKDEIAADFKDEIERRKLIKDEK